MITSRKVSQVNVFAGSPWEVASVKSLFESSVYRGINERQWIEQYTHFCSMRILYSSNACD
mgnify:CR=1 FL=1